MSAFDLEMQKALEADGEKLRQLTGEDHGPFDDDFTLEPTDERITYRGYVITYDAPPIPDRRWDWHFVHENYDGAPDSGDHRHGDAASLTDAMCEIDLIEDATA